MKTKIVLSLFAIITISIFSCKKKEEMASPTITLNGANPMNIEVGGTYTDPGAVGVDGKGNSLVVSVAQNVNTDSIGQYTVTYGTDCGVRATRTVNVIMSQSAALGTYTISSNCNAGSGLSILGANGNVITVTANGSNGITLDHPDASSSGITSTRDPFVGTFNGNTLSSINGTATISGFGSSSTYIMTGVPSFSPDGQVLTVNYSWPDNGSANAGNCTANYTKQ